jgi:outer membrane protein
MKNIVLLLAGLLISQAKGYSQDTTLLTPAQAVEIALQNNYDIRLARADVEIARLNNTRANAGMLPTVDLVADEQFTVSAFSQKRANGDELNRAGVPVNNVSAGVLLNWTLFDGRRMFIVKRRLEQLEQLGQLNLQTAVEQTTAEVLNAYYEIVRSRLQERAFEEVIVLNEERLRIAAGRLAAGFAGQTDSLQARIDLNQRRADLIVQQNLTASAKRALNRLLVRPADTPFEVQEDLALSFVPVRETLLANLRAGNAVLLALQQNAEVAATRVEEARTLNRPVLVGLSQFNLLRSDNPAGFAVNNNQAGLTVGASLRVPLYAGGNLRRQVEVARVEAEQARLQVEAQRVDIENTLDDQLALFTAQQQVLRLEEENAGAARLALQVSTERFRLGQTTALEVQQAQSSFEQALTRRNLVLYNLRASEVRLRFLAGEF